MKLYQSHSQNAFLLMTVLFVCLLSAGIFYMAWRCSGWGTLFIYSTQWFSFHLIRSFWNAICLLRGTWRLCFHSQLPGADVVRWTFLHAQRWAAFCISADRTGRVEAEEEERMSKEWLWTEVTFDLFYGCTPRFWLWKQNVCASSSQHK